MINIQNVKKNFQRKIWMFFLALGPFWIFSTTGWISNQFGMSLFAELVIRPGISSLTGVFLMLFSTIAAMYSIKKLSKDPKSVINTISNPKVWVSLFLVMSLAGNVVYFQISVWEGFSEEYQNAMTKDLEGEFFLAFIIGFTNPLWGALIFNKKELKQIFRTKYDSLYPKVVIRD